MNKVCKIIKPGMYSTIQTLPDYKAFKIGRSCGGSLDVISHELANVLVGNNTNEPVLEITMMGPTLLFLEDAKVAITGATFDIYLDDIEVSMHQLLSIKHGQTLKFGRLKNGCRAYLSIGGQWLSPTYSNHSKPLKIDDEIEIITHTNHITSNTIQLKPPRTIESNPTLKVWKGPEFSWLNKESQEQFFNQSWKISPLSNRMGYRLVGQELVRDHKAELISSAVLPGTIQLANDGMPIILLNDAQITGGYPRIGVIDQVGVYKMAQLKPGDELRFVLNL